MHHHIRALLVLAAAVPLVAGCSSTSRSQRMSEAEPMTPPPPAVGPAVMTAGLAPIPGQPPVTVSGVLSSRDATTGIVTLTDGRAVKLSPQSTIVRAGQPGDAQPGDPVVVRDALPIGVRSTAIGPGTGRHQRMATIDSVDEANHLVKLKDGSVLRVDPSTNLHLGTGGQVLVLSDLRPGDDIVAVIPDDTGMVAPGTMGVIAYPSALPRQGMSMGTTTVPSQPDELMVFRRDAP